MTMGYGVNRTDEKNKWIEFKEKESKPKTKVFSVWSKCSNCELGEIKWHPSWRHYCFFPTIKFKTIHSDRCLLKISQFITELNEEHKENRWRNKFWEELEDAKPIQ